VGLDLVSSTNVQVLRHVIMCGQGADTHSLQQGGVCGCDQSSQSELFVLKETFLCCGPIAAGIDDSPGLAPFSNGPFNPLE
jgi:hypothetical protein